MHYLRTYLTCLFIIPFCSALAQNKLSYHGLKYGHWDVGNVACDYRIVAFSFFDTVGFDGADRLQVRQHNGRDTTTETIRISGYFGDSVSVLDGYFMSKDTAGRLIEVVEYRNGTYGSNILFHQWDTAKYSHVFQHVDSNYYDTYVDNKVFSRMYFRNRELRYDYYPGKGLVIADAAPKIYIDLSRGNTDTVDLVLTARTEQFVNGIGYGDHIALYDAGYHPAHFPIAICPGDTIRLHIADAQWPQNMKVEDTLTIMTPEGKYRVYLTAAASHLNKDNITTLKSMTVSRKKDKYLVVYSCGPYGHMLVSDTTGSKMEYKFEGDNLYMISLTDLPGKAYKIDLRMCYDDGMGIGSVFDLYIKD